MERPKIGAGFTPAIPGRKIILYLLAFSPFVSGISALNPAVASAHALPQPAVLNGSQAESDSDLKFESLVAQAQEAQNRGDYRSAAIRFQEALKLRPHFAEIRTNLGLMYHLLDDYRQAVEQFELALGEKPELFVPNLFLGLDLLALHKPRKALRYLQCAQHLSPNDQRTALGLGQAFVALREFQPANDWYFHAAEMSPKDSEALYGLGITYLDLQRAAASELGSQSPDSPYIKRSLAELFEQEGRVNDAVNLYQKLLAINVTWPGLKTALGFDYVRQGDIPLAKTEFQAELSQNPGFLLARLGLARTSLEQGDRDQYTREVAEIWRIDPAFFRTNADSLFSGLAPEKALGLEEQLGANSGGTLDADLRAFLTGRIQELRQGQTFPSTPPLPKEMRSSAQMALPETGNPSDLYQQGRYSSCAQKLKGQKRLDRDLLLTLSRCSYYSGDFRTSFVAAGQVLTVKPAESEALYWRIASSSKLAIQTLFAAGLADPDSYRIHLLLGEAYRMMKRYGASELEYQKALELKPQDPVVHLGLATLYWQEKDNEKALPQVKDALAGRPHDPEASYLMGDILVARHQYPEAQPYLTVAFGATGPTVYYAHALMGKIYASDDQKDKAIKELLLALPGDVDGSFHFQLYQLYKKVGDEKAAAAALRDSETIRQRQALEIQAGIERSE